VRKDEAVQSLAHFAHEFAFFVILEKPRRAAHEHAIGAERRVVRARTGKDKNVAFGICRYTYGLPENGIVTGVQKIGAESNGISGTFA